MPSAEKQPWSLRRLTVSLQALCLCQGEHPTVDVSFRPEGNGCWVWPLWSLSSTPYSSCYLPALPDQESGSVQLVLSGVCLLIVFFFFLLASGWPDAGAVTEITTVEQK